jgi:hypothetical protein
MRDHHALPPLTHRSDHNPLVVRLEPVGYRPPGAPKAHAPIRRIVSPFTPYHQEALRDRLHTDTKREVAEMADIIRVLRKGKRSSKETIQAQLSDVAVAIDRVLQRALQSAMDEVGEPMPQTQPHKSGKHHLRPHQQGHINKSNAAIYKALTKKRAKLAAATRQLHSTT